MREILFRGKLKYFDQWVEGHYVLVDPVDMPDKIRKPKAVIFPGNAACNWFNKYFYGATEVLPETVGQWTGVTDKNGTKIFEGDIVKCCGEIRSVIYDVEYTEFEFDETDSVECPEGLCLCCDHDACEIIGNIHDNPELFEQGGE